MKVRALSLVLVVVLLVGSVCWMAPSGRASTNLITNPSFEDPTDGHYETDRWVGNWGGGTRTSMEAKTGTYSQYTVYEGSVMQQIYSTVAGSYYFSVMFKPIVLPHFEITMGTSFLYIDNKILVHASDDDTITQAVAQESEGYSVSNASVTVFGAWRNIVFNIVIPTTPSVWRVTFKYGEGYIDDVWFSTSGAISFYSGVSLVAPADDSTASSLDANFTYTPSMNNSIVNASLWLNSYATWQRVANTTTVTNGTLNNFTYTLPYQGVYLWNIEVWDSSNYFFASANYTLTVQQGTVNQGYWVDHCDNTTMWTPSGTVTQAVDTSDYQESYGSLNLSWTVPSSIGYTPSMNLTPPNVFGFFLKFGDVAYDSNTYIYLKGGYSVTSGAYMFLKNSTHFNLQWVWWYPSVSSSDVLIDSSHWYWIEFWLHTSTWGSIYLDGVEVINTTTFAYSIPEFDQIVINNPLGPASYKFDFMRMSDSEEYPVFLTPTIDVTSNPELNAFFSMSTNSSTLYTETLCVDGLVNETFSDLGHVGASPYLDSQDDNTSYVQTNLANAAYDQYYTFNDTTLLTVSSSVLHYRVASFPINTSVWLVVDTYFWNGSEYIQVNNFIHSGDWATLNSSALTWQLPQTPDVLNQLRLKVSMHLNQQVSGTTYMGRLSAVWIDVNGYGSPEGSAVHQTPYSFNPVSATYVFTALNTSLYSLGTEYSFSGFTYTTGSYVGTTLILTSLSGITSITLEYSMAPSPSAFLVPFMFLFWVIGLLCLFLSPIYAIDKVKKREYLVGLTGGVVLGAIGFGLFIGGLWGISI